MKERIITASVLIAVFATAMYVGNEALFILLSFLLVVGSYEIYLLNKTQLKPIIVPILVASTAVGGLIDLSYVPFFAGALIIILFSLLVVFEWYTFENVGYMYILIMMLVLAIQSVNLILGFDRLVFIYVLLATYLTDTFAYFGGMLFGKHKLIERISPKKTIEGAVIGYSVSALLSFIYGYYVVTQFLPLSVVIIGSLIMPLLGQIGDLAFSSIKRYFNVKDFGFIFPGHGGVLDRIDSVIFNALFFAALIAVVV